MDDNLLGQYLYGFPIFEAYNLTATVFINTDTLGNAWRMNITNLQELQAAGWEIGTHGTTHSSMVDTLSLSETENELRESKVRLETNGLMITSMAYPYGHYNATVAEIADRYYIMTRGVISGNSYFVQYSTNEIGRKEVDGMSIPTDMNQIFDYIDWAIENKSWINFYWHNVLYNGTIEDSYGNLSALLEYARDKVDLGELEVCTFSEGVYRTRDRSLSFESQAKDHNSLSHMYYDMSDIGISSPKLILSGYTLNNSILNSGLESWEPEGFQNITDWGIGTGSNGAWPMVDSHSGTYCAKVSVDSADAGVVRGIYQWRTLEELEVEIGDYFAFSAWIKVRENSDIIGMRVRMDYYNDAVYLSRRSASLTPTTEYEMCMVSGVIPAETTKILFFIHAQTMVISDGVDYFMCDSVVGVNSSISPGLYFEDDEPTRGVILDVNGVNVNCTATLASGYVRYISIAPVSGWCNITMNYVGGCGVVQITLIGNLEVMMEYGAMAHNESYNMTRSYAGATTAWIFDDVKITPADDCYLIANATDSFQIGLMDVSYDGQIFFHILNYSEGYGSERFVFTVNSTSEVNILCSGITGTICEYTIDGEKVNFNVDAGELSFSITSGEHDIEINLTTVGRMIASIIVGLLLIMLIVVVVGLVVGRR